MSLSSYMTTSSRPDELIARIYEVAADPGRLLELRSVLERMSDDELNSHGDPWLAFHFERAEAILPDEVEFSGVRAEYAAPGSFTLGQFLDVIEVSSPETLLREGEPLPDWIWLPHRDRQDKALLKGVFSGEHAHGILQLFTHPEAVRPTPHFVRRAADASHLIVQEIPIRWEKQSAAAFARDFSLTQAEQALLHEIIERSDLRKLAAERGTSLGTVRNQLKRLLAKLEIGSQGELIALYGGYRDLRSLYAVAEETEQSEDEARCMPIDHLQVQVHFYGPKNGAPALYFHPLFGGPFLPDSMVRCCHEKGIRLIVPWRPYCGRDADEGKGIEMVRGFVDRAAQILEQLAITDVAVLTASGGTPFALAFAQRFPERCTKLVIAGPTVPISTSAELRMLGLGHRLPLQLARLLPAAMRMYVRAVLGKLAKGLDGPYLEHFFADSAPDRAFIAVAKNRDFLSKSMRAIFDQGPRCGMEELMLNASDWSELAVGVDCPVTILTGTQDRLAPPEMVHSFATRHGFTIAPPQPDAGSFLIFQHPGAVMEMLGGSIARSRSN